MVQNAAKTFASENEKLTLLFVFVIQAVYIVVKTTERMKKAIPVFMKDRWRKLREVFEYVKENFYAFIHRKSRELRKTILSFGVC